MAFRKEGGSYSPVTFGRKVKKLDGGASAKVIVGIFYGPFPERKILWIDSTWESALL